MRYIVLALSLIASALCLSCSGKRVPLDTQARQFVDELKEIVRRQDGATLYELLAFSVRKDLQKQLGVLQKVIRENPTEGKKLLSQLKIPHPEFLSWQVVDWLTFLLSYRDYSDFLRAKVMACKILPAPMLVRYRAKVVVGMGRHFYQLQLKWEGSRWRLEKLEIARPVRVRSPQSLSPAVRAAFPISAPRRSQ